MNIDNVMVPFIHTCKYTYTYAHTHTHAMVVFISFTHPKYMFKLSCQVASLTLTLLPLGVHPSYVQGFIHDGLFIGVVHAGNDTYHLEPSWRYFEETDVDFHSVIYRASDVKHPLLDGQGISKWDDSEEEWSHVGTGPKSGGFPGNPPASRGLRSTHSLSRCDMISKYLMIQLIFNEQLEVV